jgi:hypothetical protein
MRRAGRHDGEGPQRTTAVVRDKCQGPNHRRRLRATDWPFWMTTTRRALGRGAIGCCASGSRRPVVSCVGAQLAMTTKRLPILVWLMAIPVCIRAYAKCTDNHVCSQQAAGLVERRHRRRQRTTYLDLLSLLAGGEWTWASTPWFRRGFAVVHCNASPGERPARRAGFAEAGDD